MGCDLFWTRKVKGERIGDGLKWVLEKKYKFPRTLDSEDISYLEGLRDAGIDDCSAIIDAIKSYGEIRIEWEL